MRIHLSALAHRDVTHDWEPCAYTGKLLRLCRMLTDVGHEVVLYSGPRNDAPVAEHVVVVTEADRYQWFGSTVDWSATVFNQFDPASEPWSTTNARTIAAMRERLGPTDVIGLTMGRAQEAIARAFPSHVVAEVGVGYSGVVSGTHRCYESEAWRHYLYGATGVDDGRFFDVVIPNAFDPADYLWRTHGSDYLLYLGRMTPRKGLEIVAELAKHHRVITAGPGEERVPGAEHLGVVKGREKAELLAGARALLVPTVYVEPFGGVAVEAMLSGTPVITSPFGAFSETVAEGVSGFRCHTLAEFLEAAKAVDELDEKNVRRWALERYTLDVVAPQYDRWLRRLATLYWAGWYA